MSVKFFTDKIFDCHFHVENGINNYDLPTTDGNIIFNNIESYKKLASEYLRYYHSLIFDFNYDLEYYRALIDSNKIVCLKIHSRLQRINESKYPALIKRLSDLNRNIPIIYDAFYVGSQLEYQPNLFWLIQMVEAFPDRKFVVAHAGGYEILKYFFHLRELDNVGFDLSLSLQYLEDSSCRADLIKLIKYTSKERIFFGSDFPHASPLKQVEILKNISKELQLDEKKIVGILNKNWKKFLSI